MVLNQPITLPGAWEGAFKNVTSLRGVTLINVAFTYYTPIQGRKIPSFILVFFAYTQTQ